MTRGAKLDEIERVYRARFAEYQRVAGAIVGDPDAARDAVQDAFAAAVRTRASFRGDGSLDAWLWRAVVNAALNERRRRRPASPPPARTNGDSGGEQDADLRVALALLPIASASRCFSATTPTSSTRRSPSCSA